MSVRVEQKEKSREAILESCAKLLREKGISGARVADVMRGAGLTVGAFYAHFASKDELVDESLRETSAAMRDRLFTKLEDKDDPALLVLERYLCRAHRDEIDQGCPFPAIVGEIATSAPEHRSTLAEQIERMTKLLEDRLPSNSKVSRKHVALGLVALMVGGLTLARAVRGTPLSDEVLKACRSVGSLVTRKV